MITREFDLVIRIPQQDYIDTGIKLVQNDNVYIFNLRITDGITDIDYNQVDHATITFKKRDGHVVQGNLVPADTGYTYKLGTNEIARPGKVTASIQLFGEDGERLTTARFQFEVVADLITPGAVQSESRFPILQQLVADVEQLKQDIVNLQIPDNSIMDEKLSNAAGQIKQRFATHMADNAAHGVSHKNLLHNWDFRNPVNQRGQNEYTGSGYAVDRWHILGNATATINNEYLSVKTNAVAYIYFRQFIENLKAYYGKTLTFSVETADGQIYTKTVTLPTSGTVDTSPILIGDWLINLHASEADVSNNVFQFRFWCTTKADAIINLRRIKLELGDVSTLANDPPADYGEQLMLCKRFFRLWTTEAARTEALKEVGLMRIPNPTLGTINIGGTTYYYASADL